MAIRQLMVSAVDPTESARTLCTPPGSLEAACTSLNGLGTSRAGPGPDLTSEPEAGGHCGLQPAAIRTRIIEPVLPPTWWTKLTGVPCFRRPELACATLSGYRLSRWSTVGCTLRVHPRRRLRA